MKKRSQEQRIVDLEAKLAEVERKAEVWEDVAQRGKDTVLNEIGRKMKERMEKRGRGAKSGVRNAMAKLRLMIKESKQGG